ncbi:MAG: N-acetyltransferase [Archangium sp.]|nr:N-acetyltransferase [Archangium sp.]
MRRKRVVEEPPALIRRAVPAGDVVVSEVRDPLERDAFIRFQLDHYRGDPSFVPPIVAERRDFLSDSNPFFEQARCAFFLAKRHGRVVGRIAAVVDSRYNRFHDTRDGFFGLFESENDAGVAAALVERASEWVHAIGMQRLVGPINLAFHHDCGLLVEGFDRPPSMMMPYNPQSYARLLEACGLTKLKDLWSWELLGLSGLPPKIVRLAERVRASGSVRIRRINTANPDADIRAIKAIYETMLKPGFGFAPVSDTEFDALVHRVRPVILLRPELSLIAEVGGEAVAFGITLPDLYPALKAANGYLFPFGMVKLLWAVRGIDRLRVLLFGIKDGYRRRGIDALLALETFETAQRLGYASGEIGWVLEDDTMNNRIVAATGARRFKTYRIYSRDISG